MSPFNSDDPLDDLDPENLPPGYSLLSLSTTEVDYLKSYWELRDTGALFGWSLRLLHDLTKAEEAGWVLILQKAKIDMETKAVVGDAAYKPAALQLEWMMPGGGGFKRLPLDVLEETLKLKPTDEKEKT